MDHLIIDCDTGETVSVPLTADEIAEREAQAEQFAAQQAAADAEKQAAQQAQLTAAQALIATSSNQQQADAMTAFMRTLGLPL